MKMLSLLLAAVVAAAAASPLCAAKPPENLTAKLATAAQRATGEKHKLAYKFAAGDELRYQVTHLVAVETSIEGTAQKAHSKSVSTKLWKVSEVDAAGNMKFVHMVADVDMWQKVDRREEVRYNSRTDKEVPAMYEQVAQTVGVPLATVTISPAGEVIKREDLHSSQSWGGQLIAPLPAEEVQVGDRWYYPMELTVRTADGRVLKVKIRQQYELKSVDDHLATISLTTQVLSPVNDPKIRVQMVQRMTAGTLTFDMAAGRMVQQDLHLDQTIIGFSGESSIMNYLGKFTEELAPVSGPQTASR